MNHWLQQATGLNPIRPSSTHTASRPCKPSQKGPKLDRVRALVQRQPVNTWFSAADIFDETVCSEDYVRGLLKGMAERGELVASFQNVKAEYTTQVAQSRNKWMFKREK